jgi:3'(2'), 5'-bisphosphate nucleotidase
MTTPPYSEDWLRDLVWRLLPSVLAAGAVEMKHYRSDLAVESKADQSPVTIADKEAEAILLDALAAAEPGIPVVAEEAVAAGQVPRVGGSFFLVDPLDGTREFINQRDEFTVNVALIDDGCAVLGIVYAPALGDLYATLGRSTAAYTRLLPDARPKSLDDCGWQQIQVRQPNHDHLTAVASRSHMTPETESFLAKFAIGERSNSGSSLKFCSIARGEADIYPRLASTMEWDTAAGHAILLAAGGSVTAPDGQPFRYGKSSTGFKNGHFVAWGGREPFPPRG